MNAEKMTTRQCMCLFMLFSLSGGLVFGVGGDTGRDAWITLILSFLTSVPLLLIYIRILSLFPQMDFYDIIRLVLGKWVGGFLLLLFVLYALWQGAFCLRSVSEFFIQTTLPNPPWLLLPAVFLLAAIMLLRQGGLVQGKWGVAAVTVMSVVFLLTLAAAFKDFRYGGLLPLLRKEPQTMFRGIYETASVPFLEGVLFLPFLSREGRGVHRGKVLLGGSAAAGGFLLLITLHNILLLGESMLDRVYFPFFSASKVLTVGQFLTRLETAVFLCIIFAGLIRLSLCLSAAQNGLSGLMGGKNPLHLTAPLALTALLLSDFMAQSISDLEALYRITPYISGGLFQILVPVLLWIGAELKNRRIAKIKRHI